MRHQIGKRADNRLQVRPEFAQVGDDRIIGSSEWMGTDGRRRVRYQVLTLRDGKIVDMQGCASRREAERLARRHYWRTAARSRPLESVAAFVIGHAPQALTKEENRMLGRRSGRRPVAVAALALPLLALFVAGSAGAANRSVIVAPGQPIEIALVLNSPADYAAGAGVDPVGIQNAVKMAAAVTPLVAGHRIQIDDFTAPCTGDPADVPANYATAQAVAADPQIVAVIGHACSLGFGGEPAAPATGPCPTAIQPNALAYYESVGLPTINGSTTNRCLPLIGPTVFNRTAVADPDFDAWYANVQKQLPDRVWSALYQREFGSPPPAFADLYFDATTLLLNRIGQVARRATPTTIDENALAAAIRHTTNFPGVTCSVTIDPATGNRVEGPPLPKLLGCF